MRKALVLAAAMVFALAGTASAAPARPAMVTGHYTYDFSSISGVPGDLRTTTVIATDSSSPRGIFLRTVSIYGAYAIGRVECLSVSGRDAWVAGPVIRTQDGSQDGSLWLLLRLRDGVAAGGDQAITWGETPADGLNLCQTMSHDFDSSLLPLVSGYVKVTGGH